MAKIYKDITSGFAPNPFTGDPSVAKGERAIIQSLKNLVLVDLEERPFQPDLGSNIKGLLFENPSPIVEDAMRERIEVLITEHEPRVTLEDIIVNFNIDKNRFDVTIKFTVVSLPSDIETTIFLQRLT